MLVRAGSISRTATSRWERRFEGGQVVVGDDPGGLGRVDRRAHVALARRRPGRRGPGSRSSRRPSRDSRSRGRAIFGPAGDHPGEPDREAVGVGRGEGELPVLQAEPALELLAAPHRVLGREHVGDAPAVDLALDRGDRGRCAVAGHRPGVTEAEVDVLVAVDVGEMGAGGGLDEDREAAGPLDHPVHRHAREERVGGALEEGERAGVVVAELLDLAIHQGGGGRGRGSGSQVIDP
jgi:hypothetical protein